MKERWHSFFQKLKNPPKWAIILTFTLSLLSAAGALLTLLVQSESMLLEILSYCLYGVAALSLAYAVYIIVLFAPRMKKSVMEWLQSISFVRALMSNYGLRTVIFSIGSFSMSILFGLYNGALGIIGRSIWFGALAAYYILLAFLRGGILLYHGKKKFLAMSEKEKRKREIRIYRNGGLLLLVLNIALSSAMAQMIFNDEGFSYAGWTIYAFAAYAFYKIGMAIYNLFKARKQDDLTVQAIRNINLMDAAVSILALQTALLHTFSGEGVDVSIYNTLTASAVTAIGLFLVVSMLVRTKRENTNE